MIQRIINGNSPKDLGYFVAGTVFEFIDTHFPLEQRGETFANIMGGIAELLMTQEGAKMLEEGAKEIVAQAAADASSRN